ncbi:hypothetical protein [Paenarthrobacter histidinolovorans]|uniref:Peptidase C39-like domain-containing protein n=1 Tax=Paenarthrobacter histidinolovorans TaxID=43664 RepID=A0ABW8NCS4_9MICC
MTGASARLLTWLAVMATLLTACTPAVDLPGTDGGQPAATSSALPTAGSVATAPSTKASPTAAPVPPAPAVPAAPAPPPAIPQPFAFNLYQAGDFVPQYTFDWCVAASVQMTHNLIDDTGGASWTDSVQQGQLWEMARARSSDSFNGANPYGWAQVLTESGMGPYTVVSVGDYDGALQTAARAMAVTGRPVGLVMWSGRHAWVMSGFESMGDPALFPEFKVTGIHVMDPLYPYGSGQWGPSPEPNSLLSPQQLATQFVVREPRRWSSGLPTGYLLVLPVAA